MRQGVIVTAMLCLMALPTAFLSNGTTNGSNRPKPAPVQAAKKAPDWLIAPPSAQTRTASIRHPVQTGGRKPADGGGKPAGWLAGAGKIAADPFLWTRAAAQSAAKATARPTATMVRRATEAADSVKPIEIIAAGPRTAAAFNAAGRPAENIGVTTNWYDPSPGADADFGFATRPGYDDLVVGEFRMQPTAIEALPARVQPQDYGAAVGHYALAMDSGNADARYAIAVKYREGSGVEPDRIEPDLAAAARWMLSAAALGHARAAFDLAGMYVEAKGVARNYPAAWMWYSVAGDRLPAEPGRGLAQEKRARVARAMKPDELAEAARMLAEWQPKLSRSDPASADPAL